MLTPYLKCIVTKLFDSPIYDSIPKEANDRPIDDFTEGDDAESKTKTKEPTKWGDELNHAHSDTPLKLWEPS